MPSTHTTTSVLFVCVGNAGKSQMAAALTKLRAPHLEVHSAGTSPKSTLNSDSVKAIAESGADLSHESPKGIDPQLLNQVDRVIIVGKQAEMERDAHPCITRWLTEEPSERGINGLERMRLIRDEIDARVRELITELS